MSLSSKLCKPFRKADLTQQDMTGKLALIPDFNPDLNWNGSDETSLRGRYVSVCICRLDTYGFLTFSAAYLQK
ncbi:MAG: hypothetical protein ABSB79_12030 [Syntrophales bacterium]|jgi:hypothetical protein